MKTGRVADVWKSQTFCQFVRHIVVLLEDSHRVLFLFNIIDLLLLLLLVIITIITRITSYSVWCKDNKILDEWTRLFSGSFPLSAAAKINLHQHANCQAEKKKSVL